MIEGALLIRPVGLFEIFHGEKPLPNGYINRLLAPRDEEGHAQWDSDGIEVHFLISSGLSLEVNNRAKNIVGDLTGVYFNFAGPVVIVGLEEDRLREIVG